MKLKVLLLGHSYVRDLEGLGHNAYTVEGVTFELQYMHISGGTFESFIDGGDLLRQAFSFCPDIVIVILGGNDLTNAVTNEEFYQRCRTFYVKLKAGMPGAFIIHAQIELRFYKSGNRWNAPVINDYKKRRVTLNNFLKRVKCSNAIMMIGGPNRMDCKAYYRDGVHLNRVGLVKYFDILKGTLQYHSDKMRRK